MSGRPCSNTPSTVFRFAQILCGWRSTDNADIIDEPVLIAAHEEDQSSPIQNVESESSDLKNASLVQLENDYVQNRCNEMRHQILGADAYRDRERSPLELFLGINLMPSTSLPSEPNEEKNTTKENQAFPAFLLSVVKNVYREHPDATAMTPAEANEWRTKHNYISVDGLSDDFSSLFNIPNPVITFDQGFYEHPEIMRDLYKQGFEIPKPIQSQAWPILLSGKDLICVAQIGTGKTLAFLLPALIHVYFQPVPPFEHRGPKVLILTPSRVHAEQIELQFSKFDFHGIKAVCVQSTDSCENQTVTLPKGAQIVIATPQQFSSLLKYNPDSINIKSISFVVLDEADRMVEMDFNNDIRRSLADIRKDRHTVMTLTNRPTKVGWLVLDYMKNPLRVMANELDLTTIQPINQNFVFLEENEKLDTLMNFLGELKSSQKLIIFCSKEVISDWVSSDKIILQFYFHHIYAELDSPNRQSILRDFNSGKVNVLVATHSMSRGLVIDNLTHIINFNIPDDLEEYVHCISKTGLVANTGKVISYITPEDYDKATELVLILENIDYPTPKELIYLSYRYEKLKAAGKIKAQTERRKWIY